MSSRKVDYASAMRALRKIADDNEPGTVSCNEDLYNQRERLIGILAVGLVKREPGAVRVAPMVVREDTPSSLIARRLAWIVFQEQFPVTMRWAVHRDPFYADTATHLLPDATRAAIQTYQAASERRYRGFLKKARKDMKTESRSSDPFVSPLKDHSSPSELSVSNSSHNSSSSPITSRNLRTTRDVAIAAAPPSTAETRGFVVRRRL